MMESQKKPDTGEKGKKYLVRLYIDGRSAVVIDWTPEEARRRAWLHDIHGGWENASMVIIAKVGCTRTNQILAIERKR